MRAAAKVAQARIRELNPMHKHSIYRCTFVHCYALNLNRALQNATCDVSNSEVKNFFGVVELVFTFEQGSPARHSYFLQQQKISCPDADPLRLKGLSMMRWNCRESALRRLSTEHVFVAVIAKMDYVSMTTTDGCVHGTAAGLLTPVNCFNLSFACSC